VLEAGRMSAAERPLGGVVPSPKRQMAAWMMVVFALLALLYVFLASSGHFVDAGGTFFNDQQAEGFRAGHLYVRLVPHPRLASARNPLDFSHQSVWLWDSSLYRGHYYHYFGPVPALGVLLAKFALGIPPERGPSDQWPTVVFLALRAAAAACLLYEFALVSKLRIPSWLPALLLLAWGTMNPTPWVAAHPLVYEASASAGQAFCVLGLWLAMRGLRDSAHEIGWFSLASLCWALAFGSRAPCLLAVPGLVLATLWLRSTRPSAVPARRQFSAALALSVPVGCAVAAYGFYNWQRFDSPTEFGLTYQTSGQPFWSHVRFVLPNLYSYLFGPVRLSCEFPFVFIERFRSLSTWLTWPPGYANFEYMGGLVPTSGLALVAFLPLAASMARGFRPLTATSRWFLWLTFCSLSLLLPIVPALFLWLANMRYAMDAASGLGMLGVLGCLILWDVRSRWASWITRPVVGLALLFGIFAGPLAALRNDDFMKRRNPELYSRMAQNGLSCAKAPSIKAP
jgi:hypothetical protein